MPRTKRNPVSKGGSHVREPKASAPLPPFDRKRVGGVFAEGPRCACGETGSLRWVTVERSEQDEEGAYRTVTTAAWVCAGCRQGTFSNMLWGTSR